ncbi:hypothetical protein [Candidatus Albibeggiatoa sp. nov. BB20]|uniref:NACHT domain-containing protein n=1 Tax=Candidatus Albibeggiatoa sp. nov. BB20 TaxID=3162723 RepID=UPI0033658E54
MSILALFFLITTLISACFAFYYWLKAQSYTRERFAFTVANFIVFSSLLLISSLSAQQTLWQFAFDIIVKLFDPSYSTQSATAEGQILSVIVLLAAYYVLFLFYKNWSGQQSVLQFGRQKGDIVDSPIFIFTDSFALIQDRFRAEKITISQDKAEEAQARFEPPESPAWHQRVSELWNLKHPEYEFFEDNDWHETHQCWIVKHLHTEERLVLACLSYMPDNETLLALINYVQKVQTVAKSSTRIVIALETEYKPIESTTFYDYQVDYFTESQLLDDLVNFDSYLNYLRRIVSQGRFADLDLSLEQMYTISDFKLKSGERQQDIEAFIMAWLAENSQRHLSVLGEYGYGKSTLSQMLSYRLLKQYQQDKSVRVPIIIELRGKSPRNLSPEEMFSTWKQGFNINPRAMMQLLLAGRLLVIFEGFDEVDLAGDREMRLRHFESLWLFAHDKSKVLFTGRPNFFFDEKELEQALLIQQPSESLPYCQVAYLVPFHSEQIKLCLRNLTTLQAGVQQEILDLAQTNPNFLEVVSRPSALRMVASIWKEANLSQHKDRINSAYVMDLFIQKTNERQLSKELRKAGQTSKEFSRLSSAERTYFMQGIAVYMAAQNLPNQITSQDLEKVTRRLIDCIPEKSVCAVLPSYEARKRKPLKQRLDFEHNRNKAIESILTDVRACGLLVTDLTKPNTFQFSHKSFMEFLAGKTYADWTMRAKLSNEEKRIAASFKQAFKLTKIHILRHKEIRNFFSEMLITHLQNSGIVEKGPLSKQLLATLISPFHWIQKPFLWVAVDFWEKFKSRIQKNRSFLLVVFLGQILIVFTFLGAVEGIFIGAKAGTEISAAISATIGAFTGAGTGLIIIGLLGVEILLSVILTTLFLSLGLRLIEGLGSILGLPIFLSIYVPNLLISFAMSLLIGRKSGSPDYLWANYALWYEICTASGIDRDTMAKVVGKRVMILFEDPPEEQK